MTTDHAPPTHDSALTMLARGPDYVVAMSSEPGTLVPFPSDERDDGITHAWIDLRGHPERVDSVPEASRSTGLAELLRTLADPVSDLMTGGCDCGLFESGGDSSLPPLYASGYIDVMFKDAALNANPQNLVDLAGFIVENSHPPASAIIHLELIVEPLRKFFGRLDCYSLMVKPAGFGHDEASAWAAFDEATRAVARALAPGD